jgi:integrase
VPKRATLTDITIKALKPPAQGQITVWDAALSNFGVRVSQGGSKTFIVLVGSGRRRAIGRYPLVTLSQARAAAKRMLAERALSHAAPALTLADAVSLFLAACEQRNRPRTVQEYGRLLRHFAKYAMVPLEAISTHQVTSTIDALLDTPAEANHALVAAKVFFNWAVRRRYVQKSPCSELQAPARTVSRDRVLADDELAKVFATARLQGLPFGTIVQLLMLTGQRRSEIAMLRAEWIDRDAKTITLPSSITKNRRQHTFPFGDTVMRILNDLPREGLLFPARGKPNHSFNGWGKSKARFDRLCPIPPWTLHDLRRTLATNMAGLNVPPHVVEKLLNHISGTVSGVAAVYNRFLYVTEMRSAIDAWEARLANIVLLSP